MKRLLFILGFTFLTIICFSQTTLKLEEVSKHVGDSVTVCGKVAGGRYLEQLEGSPTFLNLGAAYPDQSLTVVIWKDVRGAFEQAPETLFKDKEICVTGKIALFRDRPQIVIYRKDQITSK